MAYFQKSHKKGSTVEDMLYFELFPNIVHVQCIFLCDSYASVLALLSVAVNQYDQHKMSEWITEDPVLL